MLSDSNERGRDSYWRGWKINFLLPSWALGWDPCTKINERKKYKCSNLSLVYVGGTPGKWVTRWGDLSHQHNRLLLKMKERCAYVWGCHGGVMRKAMVTQGLGFFVQIEVGIFSSGKILLLTNLLTLVLRWTHLYKWRFFYKCEFPFPKSNFSCVFRTSPASAVAQNNQLRKFLMPKRPVLGRHILLSFITLSITQNSEGRGADLLMWRFSPWDRWTHLMNETLGLARSTS